MGAQIPLRLLPVEIPVQEANQIRFLARQMRQAETALAVREQTNCPELMAAPERTVSNSRETINKVNNPANEVQRTQDRMEIKGSNRVELVRTVNRLPMKASNPGKAVSEDRVRVKLRLETASEEIVVSNQTGTVTTANRLQPKVSRMDKADKTGRGRPEIMDSRAIVGAISNWQIIIPVNVKEAVNVRADRMAVAIAEIP